MSSPKGHDAAIITPCLPSDKHAATVSVLVTVARCPCSSPATGSPWKQAPSKLSSGFRQPRSVVTGNYHRFFGHRSSQRVTASAFLFWSAISHAYDCACEGNSTHGTAWTVSDLVDLVPISLPVLYITSGSITMSNPTTSVVAHNKL